jgi:N-acetylneuraminate synthase
VDLNKDSLITKDSLTFKKPGTGIPTSELEKVVGKKMAHFVSSSRVLKWEDIYE